MKKVLSKLEKIPLREAWKNEASDFTPWLAEAENLTMQADALGLAELECIEREHRLDEGEFRIDILCSDGNDQVIIENQLEKTNHNHLGQIITYAAGVGAKKVVWIAESFRPEHIAALEFLNQSTTDELNFFAVQIELWRIGDSPLAPKFEVVVKPNEWTKARREQTRAAVASSPAKQRQLKLWTQLVDTIKRQSLSLRPSAPRPQHWLNFSIGRTGFKLAATASHRDNRLGVELYISHADSKEQFNGLLNQKNAIEEKLGFALDWQELPDAHACRIAVWKQQCPLEDESLWGGYTDWFIDHLVKMNAVFRPTIQNLP